MTRMRRHISRLMLVLLAGVMGTSIGRAQTKPWVTAYYAGWELGNGSNGYLPVSKVDFTAMTDVVHFCLVPVSNGTLDTTSNSITQAGSAALTAAAHAVGTKVLISIGGWATESAFMGATSSSTLSTFVSNLVNFMKSRNYDGIDIDWEPINPSDYTQYESLISSLRSAMGSSYILTTTAGQGYGAVMAAVQNYVDQINIMTYDLSFPSQGWVTWYNSAVHQNGITFQSTGGAVPACDNIVQEFLAAGVAASKIGIGSEFGGFVWQGGVTTTGNGVTGPDQAWTTAPTVSVDVPLYASDGSGIMQKYYSASCYHWDSGAQASYLSIDNSGSANDYFISYEDTNDVNSKFNYVKQQGLGGMIIYSLGMGYPGNGTYPMLALVKRDMGGNTNPPPTDTTPPTVAISSPTNGATILGTITVTATASDNVGVTGVSFKIDGTQIGNTVSIAPFLATLVTTTLSNGTHTISAVATDAAGNSSTSSVSVTVLNVITGKDTTAPTVSFTSPANNSTVSGTITLSANASDNVKVSSVQFAIDGTNVGQAVTTSPYSVSWLTTNVSDGNHTLTAVAKDSAGNSATASETITVANNVAQSSPTGVSIYNNALSTGWSNGSWGATVTFNNTKEVCTGSTESMYVKENASGALRLLSGNWNTLVNVNPSQYAGLSFEIYSASSINLSVFLMGGPSGIVFPTVNYGNTAAGKWTSVTIPISQLDPASQPFTMLVVESSSGMPATYWIDNMQLTILPAPQLVAPTNGLANIIDPIVLSWKASTGASSYRVQISQDQTFASVAKDTSNVKADSLYVSGLQGSNTYYWRVQASSGSLTSQWSSAWSFAITTSGSQAPLIVFQDALFAPWMDASWNATLNAANTSPVFAGAASISVVQGAWGAASFHLGNWNSGDSINPALYTAVQFEVYSPSNTSFNLLLESDQGTSFPVVTYGSVPAGQWTAVSIPLSSLDPAGAGFSRVDILETSGTQQTYYLDNIQFAPKPSSKAALAVNQAESTQQPSTYALEQNYPNPFNPSTTISFSVPQSGRVTLKIYNTLGQQVASLIDGDVSAGDHSIVWNADNLPSGVYIYRLQANSTQITKKMILIK